MNIIKLHCKNDEDYYHPSYWYGETELVRCKQGATKYLNFKIYTVCNDDPQEVIHVIASYGLFNNDILFDNYSRGSSTTQISYIIKDKGNDIIYSGKPSLNPDNTFWIKTLTLSKDTYNMIITCTHPNGIKTIKTIPIIITS